MGNLREESLPVIEYFYTFDCMNAFYEDKAFPESYFNSDAEAIRKAADLEATLYKHRFCNGEKVLTEKLYDPWACFEEGEE